MRLKRHPIIVNNVKLGTEDWLSWQVRSLRQANREIDRGQMGIAGLLETEKRDWAGHVARYGLEDKQQHVSKYLVSWRCLSWWRQQQLFNDLEWDALRHQYPFHPKRWDDSLPAGWITKFSGSG